LWQHQQQQWQAPRWQQQQWHHPPPQPQWPQYRLPEQHPQQQQQQRDALQARLTDQMRQQLVWLAERASTPQQQQQRDASQAELNEQMGETAFAGGGSAVGNKRTARRVSYLRVLFFCICFTHMLLH
jgi:predicted exporter